MKVLAVARFTLLRLRRSRYLLSAAILLAATMGVYLVTTLKAQIGGPGEVQWGEGLARLVMWLTAIWLGLHLIQDDRADGALRSTLTRPISLPEAIFGKALGGFAALCLFALAAAGLLTLTALLRGAEFQWAMLLYLPSMLPADGLVLTLTMALAQALPGFAAGVAALLARDEFFSSRALAGYERWLPDSVLAVLTPIAKTLYWLCPPTSAFFLSYRDFVRADAGWTLYLLMIPYSLFYAVAACLAASWLLSRQEL